MGFTFTSEKRAERFAKLARLTNYIINKSTITSKTGKPVVIYTLAAK